MKNNMNKSAASDDFDDEDQPEKEVKLTNLMSNDGKVFNLNISGVITRELLLPIVDAIQIANLAKLAPAEEVELEEGEEAEKNSFEDLTHINLYIDSPGGDLTATAILLAAMDTSVIPIRTITWGECASAALIIFMAGHERLVSRHCLLMSHNASYSRGSGMQHAEDQSQSLMSNKLNRLMQSFYELYTGKDQKYIKKHLLLTSRDDVYLNWEEAIAHGIADHAYTSMEQTIVVPA